MSDYNDLLHNPNVLEVMQQLERVFRKFGINYFMAGAFARDLHFADKENERVLRRTDDIDIAVCINNEEQFQDLVKALEETGDFKQSQKEPIKLVHKYGNEIDLIPFGKIENEQRETKLSKPVVFIINMPGFTETLPFAVDIKFGDLHLKTCPIEGLIMLKLISWNDRKQRTHDLTDIDHLIDASEEWLFDEIFEQHFDLLEKYDDNDLHFYMKRVTAHVIARKMKKILDTNNELKIKVIEILSQQQNPRWEALRNGLLE